MATLLALLAGWAALHAVLAPLMLSGRSLTTTVAIDVLATAALTTGVLLVARDPRALTAALAIASALGAVRGLTSGEPLLGLDSGICLFAAALVLGRAHLLVVVTTASAAWAGLAGFGAVEAFESGARDGMSSGELAGRWVVVAVSVIAAGVVAMNGADLLGRRTIAAEPATTEGPADGEERLRDALTKVADRGGLELAAGPMIEYARRSGQAVHCLYLNVDGLREVNERVGLEGGDSVLREVARVVAECVRATDVVARWNGDEFVVIGPGSGMSPLELERRLRARLIVDPPVPLEVWSGRVSIGSSTLVPWDEGDLASLAAKGEVDMQMRRSLRRQTQPNKQR